MLRRSPYYIYISSTLFSSIASSMYTIFIGWILYEISNDAFYSGFMVGIGFVPGILLNLFFGVFIDRYNRWKVIIVSLSVQTAIIFCILYFVLSKSLNVPIIISAHIILQLTGSISRPALQAIIAQLFKKENYAKVIGTSSSLGELGWILGASSTGILLNVFSNVFIITIIFVFSIVSVICMYFLKYSYIPLKADNTESESAINDLKNGYKYLISNKIILGLIGVGFVGQLILHSNTGLLPVYTKSVLSESSSVFGLLEVTISIGAIIAGIFASKLLTKFKLNANNGSIIILMSGIIFITLASSKILAFIGMFLLGFGVTLLRVSTQSLQQMITEPKYHGRMASYRMTVNQVSVSIGSPLLGMISKYYGAEFAYASLLIPLLCSLIFSILFISKDNSILPYSLNK